MTITEIALLMLFALALTGFLYCWLMWRKALDGWGCALDAWGDAIERNKAYLAMMRQEPTPITELEAQVARLRAAVHDLRCSVDAGEFQDVVAAYLQTGDLNVVERAKGDE